MAEETPRANNTTLLIIALVLGGLTAVVYTVQIALAERANTKPMVAVLQYERYMNAGDRISEKDLTEGFVDADTFDKGDFVEVKDRLNIIDKTLKRSTVKGFFVRWSDVEGIDTVSASDQIREGWVNIAITIDPKETPQNMIRGDYVNVVGRVAINGKLRTVPILEGVQIKTDPRQRSLTIEAPPAVARQFKTVLTHVDGSVWLELINPMDRDPRKPVQIGPTGDDRASRDVAAALQSLPPRPEGSLRLEYPTEMLSGPGDRSDADLD
jgi:hypothetical protein